MKSIPLFSSPPFLFASSILLRIILLLWGLYQDATSPLKYTDIDYFVFTDAARFISRGHSPYLRATYRYTPLLAYLLLPTTWSPQSLWFHFGKVLFAVADVVAGWLLFVILRDNRGFSTSRASKFASIWLLNPMVATISTRGSSEGLLGVMVMIILWAVLNKNTVLAGSVLGLAVHFKIYPFIYAISILWHLETPSLSSSSSSSSSFFSLRQIPRSTQDLHTLLLTFFNESRILFTLSTLSAFSSLNIFMYLLHGLPFMQHTYLYHLIRTDHRHNFSPYNIILYLSSARAAVNGSSESTIGSLHLESLAFLPQLLLSAILIPLVLAKRDLPGTMLAQTFAFVAFNKVCTSQYFLWYLIFLPLYLPQSTFLRNPRLGFLALTLWVSAQAAWLQQGYQLEFLGRSTFFPGLFLSSLTFFAVNCWILGIVVMDVSSFSSSSSSPTSSASASESAPTSSSHRSEGMTTSTSTKKRNQNVGREENEQEQKRYRDVLETYMTDLSTAAGVVPGSSARDNQMQMQMQQGGMVLGEVSDDDDDDNDSEGE